MSTLRTDVVVQHISAGHQARHVATSLPSSASVCVLLYQEASTSVAHARVSNETRTRIYQGSSLPTSKQVPQWPTPAYLSRQQPTQSAPTYTHAPAAPRETRQTARGKAPHTGQLWLSYALGGTLTPDCPQGAKAPRRWRRRRVSICTFVLEKRVN